MIVLASTKNNETFNLVTRDDKTISCSVSNFFFAQVRNTIKNILMGFDRLLCSQKDKNSFILT